MMTFPLFSTNQTGIKLSQKNKRRTGQTQWEGVKFVSNGGMLFLTCVRIHLRWWWGWPAWPSGTRSRCSSTWRRCCCGGSRTCRSCCPRGVGSESQSGSAPCGQSRVHTPGNELRELRCWGEQGLRCKKKKIQSIIVRKESIFATAGSRCGVMDVFFIGFRQGQGSRALSHHAVMKLVWLAIIPSTSIILVGERYNEIVLKDTLWLEVKVD